MDNAQGELLALHDRFCQGFAERRPELVLETVADMPGLVVVTSEEALLHGVEELGAFLDRYVNGGTVYSWAWDHREAVGSDGWACLLAVGTETASSQTDQHQTPYRMTAVAERRDDRWALVQVHGSSPHHA